MTNEFFTGLELVAVILSPKEIKASSFLANIHTVFLEYAQGWYFKYSAWRCSLFLILSPIPHIGYNMRTARTYSNVGWANVPNFIYTFVIGFSFLNIAVGFLDSMPFIFTCNVCSTAILICKIQKYCILMYKNIEKCVYIIGGKQYKTENGRNGFTGSSYTFCNIRRGSVGPRGKRVEKVKFFLVIK